MQTVSKYLLLTICLASLTGCAKIVVGNFCDVYTVVDMPGSEAAKLERQYQERILANERYQFNECR